MPQHTSSEVTVGYKRRRLHDRKTEHFKALTKSCHSSAIADHIISTGHNIKWDHFEILPTGRSDVHCKIKETMLILRNVLSQFFIVKLLIEDLKPALNENVGSEKLFSLLAFYIFPADFR